jgi:Uma2 family endonuclease
MAILAGDDEEHARRLPAAKDASCVVEAAHRSLELDRREKLAIYAAAGVPQYVLVNLRNNSVEVYTNPYPASEQYETKVTLIKGQTLELMLPEGVLAIDAGEVLP